jgi:hypothetical protein
MRMVFAMDICLKDKLMSGTTFFEALSPETCLRATTSSTLVSPKVSSF